MQNVQRNRDIVMDELDQARRINRVSQDRQIEAMDRGFDIFTNDKVDEQLVMRQLEANPQRTRYNVSEKFRGKDVQSEDIRKTELKGAPENTGDILHPIGSEVVPMFQQKTPKNADVEENKSDFVVEKEPSERSNIGSKQGDKPLQQEEIGKEEVHVAVPEDKESSKASRKSMAKSNPNSAKVSGAKDDQDQPRLGKKQVEAVPKMEKDIDIG